MAAVRTPQRTENDAISSYVNSLSTEACSSSKIGIITLQAQDYYRHMKFHSQQLAQHTTNPNLMYVVACVLAFDLHGYSVSKQLAVKISGEKAKAFDAFKICVARCLKLQTKISMEEVAIRLGLEECVADASRLFSDFMAAARERYEGVPEEQTIAGCLFVVANQMGIKPPKQELLALSRLKFEPFSQLTEQISGFYRSSNQSVENLPRTKRKRGNKSAADNTGNLDLTMQELEAEEIPKVKKNCNRENEDKNWSETKIQLLKEAFDGLKKSDLSKYKFYIKKYKNELPEGIM